MTKQELLKAAIDDDVTISISRKNFWEFCLYMNPEFFAKRPFLKRIAAIFQLIADGAILTASASLAPRAGKSYLTTLFCAWWLGRNPTLAVMRNTVTASLYRKFSRDVRTVIISPKFKRVFPKVILSPDNQNLDGWSLTTSIQGAYFGGGVGTNIIGYGCNLAITDDLYSGFEQALSATYNEGVFTWKQGSHNSRMEKDCAEIYIGTRWSKNDVIGEAIETGKVQKVIKVPALINGKSFCEAVKTTEEYLKIKKDTEESIWDAEYMQDPAELKGLLFPKSSLNFFAPFPIKADHRYMCVDPAGKGGDDTSAPVCEMEGKRIYVTSVYYNNHGTDVSIPELVETIIKRRMHAVEIEGISGWLVFGSTLRDTVEKRYKAADIRILNTVPNKETRILTYSAFIKNHFYFLEEEYWNDDYRKFMKVLNTYMRQGGNKHDDAPDSLAMAGAYFMSNFSIF